MRLHRWLLVGILSVTARAADPSFAALKNYVETNHLTTVEAFVNGLSSEYLGAWTLVHHSRSLQPASAQAPRVVIASSAYWDPARQPHFVYLGVGGSAQPDGTDTVEVIEYQAGPAAFDFHRITFPKPGSGQAATFESHPQICHSCHGIPARPIWDTYGAWPGVYGSITTNTQKKPDGWEVEELKQVAGLGSQPRFRRFVGGSYQGYEYSNDVIGVAVNEQLGLAEAAKTVAAPDYPKASAALHSTAPGAGFIDDLPPDWREPARAIYAQAVTDICDSLKRVAVGKIQRLIEASQGRLERREFDFWDLSSQEFEARIFTIRRLLKVPTDDKMLSSQLPREIAAEADGMYGFASDFFKRLTPAFHPTPGTVYDPQNKLVLDADRHHVSVAYGGALCPAFTAAW